MIYNRNWTLPAVYSTLFLYCLRFSQSFTSNPARTNQINSPFLQTFCLNCQMACWCLEVVHMYLCGSAVIRSNHVNDSRRSYQSVKFLVTLANKCPVAKDYLLQSSTKWQWAVNWLKTKVSSSLNTFPPNPHLVLVGAQSMWTNVLCHF